MPLFSHDTKADALGRAPLFQGLPRGELEALAKVTEDLDVEAGKVLCREGESAREFFVIVDGEATVTAKTPLRFFVLTAQAFWSLLEHQPDVERKVLRALARRLLADAHDPTAERAEA